MFRFNFSTSDEESIKSDERCEPSVKLVVHTFHVKDVAPEDRKVIHSLYYTETKKEYNQKYSLVPKVYEGGLDVWECTLDVLNYMHGNEDSFAGKSVLDLGCGCGLLGINALKLGARYVTFQDFNFEVFEKSVFPNLCLNLSFSCQEMNCRTKFISADWNDTTLPSAIGKVDIVLSSETIYDSKNYPALLSLLSSVLSQSGKILLAAKTHYFGVGGSVEAFKSYAAQNFNSNTICTNNSSGVSRQIVEFYR